MLGVRTSARPKLLDSFASPQRADLAIAVAAHKAATDNVVKLRATVEALEAKVQDATRARWRAQAASERAVTDGPAYAVAQATGEPWEGEPVLSMKDARAAVEAATEGEREAQEALDLLRPQVGRAEMSASINAGRTLEAARAVLRAEAARIATALAADVARLRSELTTQTALLRWMAANGLYPVNGPGGMHREPVDDHIRAAVQYRPVEVLNVDTAPVCAPWRDALARLVLDAHAELPA